MIRKKVKFGHYKSTVIPPSAIAALQLAEKDMQTKAKYGERIKYLVQSGKHSFSSQTFLKEMIKVKSRILSFP